MRDDPFYILLKKHQAGLSWTHKKIAEKLGVSERTYSNWVRGVHSPPPEMVRRMATDLFDLSGAEVNDFYRAAAQVAPEKHNFPFERNSFFTGRKTYLELLANQLKENNKVVITGLGGIGKTELALEYAHSYYPKTYRTVLWVNAASKVTLEESYLDLALLLELPEQNESRVDAVKAWLEGHTGWLLVLDNADDLELINSLLPKRPLGHILLTTRSQIIENIVDPIELEKMESEEGVRFLLLRSGLLKYRAEPETPPSNIREGATRLVELLDGHPLALEQAGAYIQASKTSFASYMQIYHQGRSSLLSPKSGELGAPGEKHSETVTVTFNICFQRVRHLYPAADDVLHLCAFLSPDNIPEELFSPRSSLNLSMTMFDKVIATLRRYSLIKRNTEEKLLSIHRLVQAVLQDRIVEQKRRRWVEQTVQVINTTMKDIETQPSSRPTTLRAWAYYREQYLPHLEACAMWIKREEVVTEEAAELLDTFAYCLNYSITRFVPNEIIEALDNAIGLREKVRGENYLYIVDWLKLLIMLYKSEKNDKKVQELSERLLCVVQCADSEVLDRFPFRIKIQSGLNPLDQLSS